jgi:hypothetical protein
MAENSSPNDPQEQVVEANTQGNKESENAIHDNLQTTEAGEAHKVDDAAVQDVSGTQRQEEKKPEPSTLKVLWGKLGLDPATLILMFK